MPNRIIKESICTSDTLDLLTAEEERFFYRLVVKCDDFGRFEARPTVLRASCFPLKVDEVTDEEVCSWLNRLAAVGLIQIYEHEGRPYLQMVTWTKHQQRRASKSKYPSPDDGNCKQMISIDSKCPRIRDRKRIRERERHTVFDADARAEVAPTGDDPPLEPDQENPVGPSVEEGRTELPPDLEPDDLPPPWDGMNMRDVSDRYHARLGMMGPSTFSKLDEWNEKRSMSPGVIVAAIDIAAASKAKGIIRGSPDSYLHGVLRGLYNDGVRTAEDLKARAGPQTEEEYVAAILAKAKQAEGVRV